MRILKVIRHEANYLKPEDFIQCFKFLAALIPSILTKIYLVITQKKIWLISEAPNEARDNGYCFFRYLCLNRPDCNCYYAIKKDATDYDKVNQLGKTLKYGSIFHWIIYLCSEYNISTQKSGRPGVAIGYLLEHFHLIKEKSVFLQHGITINKATWLFYKNTFMRLFICGAKPEYEYVKECFGYPEDHVAYLGLCRFDDYFHFSKNDSQILLIPSWREWIGSKNEYSSVYEDTTVFTNTEYYQKYQSLITNPDLIKYLEENNITLLFYPHRNMQPFIHSFQSVSEKIVIADSKTYDIRKLLIESALMITDYSSVALDFAYMKKPVIYYQFDEKRFREAQYEKGYYDYRLSGLGCVTNNETDTVNAIIDSHRKKFSVSNEFLEAHKVFFPIYDNENCKRTYDTIRGLKK